MDVAALEALARALGLPPAWRAPAAAPGARAGLAFDPIGPEQTGDGDGILVAWLQAGAPVGRHLRLWPRARAGAAIWPEGSGGTPDHEVYRDGAAERFDAWSDGARPHRQPFARWAEAQARAVIGAPRCLLCGAPMAQAPIAALSADGEAHLCAGCLPGLEPAALRPRQWPMGERRCRACERCYPDETPMFHGRAGLLCAPCAAALQPAAPPPRPWWARWFGGGGPGAAGGGG